MALKKQYHLQRNNKYTQLEFKEPSKEGSLDLLSHLQLVPNHLNQTLYFRPKNVTSSHS